MISLSELIKEYTLKFNVAGIEEGLREIRLIIEEIMKIPLVKQITEDIIIKEKEKILICNVFNRRLRREPLDKIFNKKVFRDTELLIDRNTFSPRKETEMIIDLVKDKGIKPNKVLELGTGSGAVIISLMKSFKDAKAIATDIKISNLYLAKKNAIRNRVESQIDFICCNWADIFVNSDFDLILANPPYIRTEVIKNLEPEVKDFDPIIALDGGSDGLNAYRKILLGLSQKVSNESVIIFEIGCDQEFEVSSLMKEAKLTNVKVIKDYSYNPRFAIGKIRKKFNYKAIL